MGVAQDDMFVGAPDDRGGVEGPGVRPLLHRADPAPAGSGGGVEGGAEGAHVGFRERAVLGSEETGRASWQRKHRASWAQGLL